MCTVGLSQKVDRKAFQTPSLLTSKISAVRSSRITELSHCRSCREPKRFFATSHRASFSDIAGESLPLGFRRKLGRYKYGPAAFKMDWALSEPVPWKSSECSKAATIHLGGSFSEIVASEQLAASGKHAEKPFIILSQPTLFDPSRAPAGKHILWGYCHVPNGFEIRHDASHRKADRTFRTWVSRLHFRPQRQHSGAPRTAQRKPGRRRYQRRLAAPRANVHAANCTTLFNSRQRSLSLFLFNSSRRRRTRSVWLSGSAGRTQKFSVRDLLPLEPYVLSICI